MASDSFTSLSGFNDKYSWESSAYTWASGKWGFITSKNLLEYKVKK